MSLGRMQATAEPLPTAGRLGNIELGLLLVLVLT